MSGVWHRPCRKETPLAPRPPANRADTDAVRNWPVPDPGHGGKGPSRELSANCARAAGVAARGCQNAPMAPPELRERIEQHVRRHALIEPGGAVTCLVSGGPDSTCL